jgi:hypothetical protein
MNLLRRTLAGALTVHARVLGDGSAALADGRRVAAFLAGRVAYRPRPDDVFVATYPRSGTTLMQWLLHLLHNGGEPGELRHLNEVSPWFERGLSTGELTPARIDALPNPRVFKTHLSAAWVPRSVRCIAVVRDGRDVAVSYYHFYRSYLRFDGSFDEFFDRFLTGRLQYGSWFSHEAGWRARAADSNVLLVRYEDLIDDRTRVVIEVADFLGWPRQEALVAKVVAGTSFDAMKDHEGLFDHATALLMERGVRPASFLRAGQTGEGAVATGAQKSAFDTALRRAKPRRELWLPPFLQ